MDLLSYLFLRVHHIRMIGMENPNALGAGNYDVIITDSNGCAITENFSIGSNSEITLTITPDE